MYVRVAVNIPADKTFSYAAPESMGEKVALGKRVFVPFGKRVVTGYILETNVSADVNNIKEIIDIPDHDPLFSEEDLRFYRWISRYYLYPLGKTLFEILPGGSAHISTKKEVVASLIPLSSCRPDLKLTGQQQRMVDFIRQNGDTPLPILRKSFGRASYLAGCLLQKGIVRLDEREVFRSPAESPYAGEVDQPVVLNEDQAKALHEILHGLASRNFSPYLFHGVTGSGKTEVYFRAMEKTGEEGGGVIFLVPEIGLTPQLISRLGRRFGQQEIAVMHSGIPMAVRYDQWRRIQKGEVKVVVGARSALYAPVRDLRLIIVDEEHGDSYKQDDRLCYNARDMAVVKAKLSEAVVVLGTATPAVQTYFNVLKKKYRYLTLPQRVEYRTLPRFEIVDMKAERDKSTGVSILSGVLKEAIANTLAAKKQILLFLNRRGFDTVVLCPDCGYVFKCRNCAVALTHHAACGLLKCHRCDFTVKAFPSCPECRGNLIRSYGVGTEKLEEEVKRFFPEARVGRMDSDTTARTGDADRILTALGRHEIDILVGTQMITKGHDYPGITLVGVVSADLSLNVPDFRSAETTFQMLTQVAGRGGRGDTPGRVIIQTFNPGHYAIKRAQNQDYSGFYEDEIEQRKSLGYPPFARLVNLHITGIRKEQGLSGIDSIRKLLGSISASKEVKGKIEILGPAEAPVFKVRGRYRWQLLLKGKDINAQCTVVEAVRAEAVRAGLKVKVDVDPMNFM
jgi:primosomal protein N' (replication factor Y)